MVQYDDVRLLDIMAISTNKLYIGDYWESVWTKTLKSEPQNVLTKGINEGFVSVNTKMFLQAVRMRPQPQPDLMWLLAGSYQTHSTFDQDVWLTHLDKLPIM